MFLTKNVCPQILILFVILLNPTIRMYMALELNLTLSGATLFDLILMI